MKNKIEFLIGFLIAFIALCGIFYLIFSMFEKLFPEQTYFAFKLFNENIFFFIALTIIITLVEKVIAIHKKKHRIYLNKLAEIEWIQQYGDDGRVR
jgi:hypothetical protein